MSSATPTSNPGKIVARAASVHIDNACNAFLHDCFRQFGIHVVAVPHDAIGVFNRQKFEACLLRLYDPEAERILSEARNSTSNKRMVIYGIARTAHEALLHSNFGVNAILDEPLDRQSVLKVVRSTHLLVLHELRRYVRVPVISETTIESGASSANAVTMDISSGGLAVRCASNLPAHDPVKITLALPGLPKTALRAFVCWKRENDKTYGMRFDPSDDRRFRIRGWIDHYLEIV
jgi:PilZ domain-containing protein